MGERPPLRPLFNNFVRARHTGLTPYKTAPPRFRNKLKKRARGGKIDFAGQATGESAALSINRPESSLSLPIDDGRISEECAVQSVNRPESPIAIPIDDGQKSEESPVKSVSRPELSLALPIHDGHTGEESPAKSVNRPESPKALPNDDGQKSEESPAKSVIRPESPLALPIDDGQTSEESAVQSVNTPKLPIALTIEENRNSERSSGAKTQRDKVDSETTRLLQLAETWSQFQLETASLPDWVVDEIDSVVGQTRLLTTSKFKQFRSLISEYEGGDPKVKYEDLNGFWEMMFIQVEGLDAKFKNLEELKESQWERKVEIKKKKQIKKVIKKAPVVHSRIRELIQERRKSIRECPTEDQRRESSIFVPLQELTLSSGFNNLSCSGRRSSFYYRID